jgi:hypothetical protein
MAAAPMPAAEVEGYDDLRVIPCRVCGELIEPGRLFFQEENWTVLVHMVCLEQEEVT